MRFLLSLTLFAVSCASLQAYSLEDQTYSPQATNFVATRGWLSEKAFIMAHKDIFEKHCIISGVRFNDFIKVVIDEADENFIEYKTILFYEFNDPSLIRPYTIIERAAIFAYYSGYEECLLLAGAEINDGYEEALKNDKFNQSLFSGAFSAVWVSVWAQVIQRKFSPGTAVIGTILGVVYEYARSIAVEQIWNPEPELLHLRDLSLRSDKGSDALYIGMKLK